MRIVIVISSLHYGGAETQALASARQLVRNGHQVAIYTLNSENPRLHELDGTGVQCVVDQKRTRMDLAVLWRLRRFLQQFRAEVVHSFLLDADVYARLAAVGTGTVVLSSERSDDYTPSLAQRLAHWLSHKLSDGVVANSYSGLRFAQGRYGFPDSRMHVVWNGIDLAAVEKRLSASHCNIKQELFGDQDVRLACMVANIKPDKDYLLALEVAAQLVRDDPRWRVVFVGDALSKTGAYQAQVLERFQQMELDAVVRFTGRRTDVLEIMAHVDVLFSTSVREGFPNVVLEAMAVGVPVVSTQYSDIRRILPFAWQVVEQRSPQVLAAAIERAYEERTELVRVQRQWVEEHATTALCAARLESVYGRYVKKCPA